MRLANSSGDAGVSLVFMGVYAVDFELNWITETRSEQYVWLSIFAKSPIQSLADCLISDASLEFRAGASRFESNIVPV